MRCRRGLPLTDGTVLRSPASCRDPNATSFPVLRIGSIRTEHARNAPQALLLECYLGTTETGSCEYYSERPQLVTSAEVNRAQAIRKNKTIYTANDSSPCSSVVVSTGVRSSESKLFHQCVGRYGWTDANCGI